MLVILIEPRACAQPSYVLEGALVYVANSVGRSFKVVVVVNN